MKEIYKVLNPESWMAPFNAVPLNPRLNELKGKVIAIIGQAHEPMLYLKDAIKEAVPGIKEIFIYKEKTTTSERFSDRGGISKALQEETRRLGINAIIQGIAH
ncbi:MAG: hypothetical protein NTV30_01420 [Chloroflexi bacterium]|nr:hypothetical protein [Chloroflexota bacterium]